ncbi:MAG: peptide chain release factor N(5)-glutamine methyltransferase [Alphaproteobacteria bacterium]|nr:peptide chain release factor N(5)-glutamine methyltransferase [Alphaproteobacteria bacterium]
MVLKEAVIYYSSLLKEAKIRNASLETRLLLQHVLNIDNTSFIINNDMLITAEQQEQLNNLFSKRAKGIPLAYILNQQFFWKHNFYVNKNVLIPRMDSETLIQAVLNKVSQAENPHILEIGIGSGCLLLSLLHEYQNSTGVGVDVSQEALEVSKINAKNLEVSHRLNLMQSNIFANVVDSFDIIISNPPYIADTDTEISEDVKTFEPHLALFAKNNGLFFYQEILKNTHKYLKKNGLIFFEIGYKQKQDVLNIALNNNYQCLGEFKDMSHKDRVLVFGVAK